MEINVCNANTNWLRGEHDCTKDSKKMTKRERKIKYNLEGRLGLGAYKMSTHIHVLSYGLVWFCQ